MSQPSLPVAIAFALESSNPWYEHLGALAEHLGATSYYTILTDKQSLPEVLERLPEDIRLITISTTNLERPTQLVDVKDPKYGGRVVANMVSVAKPTLPVSQDVQRHIMGFLSPRDLAHSSVETGRRPPSTIGMCG